jgi:Fe-S cluster assembly protein SufD
MVITVTQNRSEPYIFDKKGDYTLLLHNVSGNVEVCINAPHVHVEIIGIYTADQNETYKLHTVQQHNAPDSSSNLLIKGVFDGKSTFAYTGLIKIAKDAQRVHAYQKNQNLMLSKTATVTSEPNLEILANDVFCTHGSTIGRLSEEQLWYAQSRGITKKDAEALLVEGFLQDVKEKIEIARLQS